MIIINEEMDHEMDAKFPVTAPVDPRDPELIESAIRHYEETNRRQRSDGSDISPELDEALVAGLHAYENSRPKVDWNTCGQAAIATILDFYGINPWKLPRPVNSKYWDAGQAIDAIKADGFGPDFIFGWGTSGVRIQDALRHYGLNANSASWAFAGWPSAWAVLSMALTLGTPVPVLVDLGRLAGQDYTFHWAVAYRTDGQRIYLANCPWNPSPTLAEFEPAWRCDFIFIPLDMRFCGVYAVRP